MYSQTMFARFTRALLGTLFMGMMTMTFARAGVFSRADSIKLDNKATEILKQAGDLFKNARSFHVNSKLTYTLTTGQGQKRVIHSEGTCALEHPNHFAYRVRRTNDGGGGVSVVCDGKRVFTSGMQMKQFTESPAPSDLSKMGATLMVMDVRNTGILFLNVVSDEPYEQLMNGVNACGYAGTEKVNNVQAHHLTLTQDNLNWEVWIAAEGKPFVLKMRTFGPMGNGGTFDVTEKYQNWQFDGTLAPEIFAFSPPQDAKRVQNLDTTREKK
jgi:hypothetical protein